VQLSRNESLLRIWQLAVTLAHEKVEFRKSQKENFFSSVPEFLIVFLTTKKP
jgi:hypothetical protein